jgi:putative transcriptional regulator
MVRMTLEQIRASKPQMDRAKIAATGEVDIVIHMAEDGEDPDAAFNAYSEELPPAQIRTRIGMTQVEFAKILQIPVASLRNWEQGRVRIDPAARALFRILSRDPHHALIALEPDRKAG